MSFNQVRGRDRRVGIGWIVAMFAGMLMSLPAFGTPFMLTSRDFNAGGLLPKRHEYHGAGCHGQNVSPQISWSGAPKGTRSFVLTVFDRTVPGGWWHWVLFNIPGSVHTLAADAGRVGSRFVPQGSIEGATTYGSIGYGGPCPPKDGGTHEYVFTLYALGVRLPQGVQATGAEITALARQHAIATAQLIARFKR